MSATTQLVVFRLDAERYALPLAAVARVIRAAAVTPLPGAPPIVIGALDVHGRVFPVLNVRRRFLMPERDIRPTDWFLLAHTSRRTVALVVDEAVGVVERPEADIVPSIHVGPFLEHFPGVVRLDEGLALIHDLERFLALDEVRTLDEAMRQTSTK